MTPTTYGKLSKSSSSICFGFGAPMTLLPFKKGASAVLFIICWVILEIGVYTTMIEELLNLSTLPRSWGGISGKCLFSFKFENRPIYSPRSIGNPHSYNTEKKIRLYSLKSSVNTRELLRTNSNFARQLDSLRSPLFRAKGTQWKIWTEIAATYIILQY